MWNRDPFTFEVAQTARPIELIFISVLTHGHGDGHDVSHTHNSMVDKLWKLVYYVLKRLEPSFGSILFFDPIAIFFTHWGAEK